MTESTTYEPTELAFEQGYERLQAIANRLNEDEVPVSEMCDLFAEGKGLELALTEFLDTQRQRVEAIERGEGIRTFRIARSTPPQGASPARHAEPSELRHSAPAVVRPEGPSQPGAGTAADDDIPF